MEYESVIIPHDASVNALYLLLGYYRLQPKVRCTFTDMEN